MPGFPRLKDSYDILIVGGGHAGLHAGLKAGLLRHSAAVISRGPKWGRSFYAPRMENIPGFPKPISGHALLDLQVGALATCSEFVGYFSPATATAVRKTPEGFEVDFDWLAQRKVARGRALILAIGVVDRLPAIEGKIDAVFPWANFGLLDFCIFCDGHELTGKSVAVLGSDSFAARTALDLLHFAPSSVEILTNGDRFLGGMPSGEREALTEQLTAKAIHPVEARFIGYEGLREKQFQVKFADGSERKYDRGFSGLGWYDMHESLPRSLGCKFDPDGYVLTDEDCRVLAADGSTPIPGLYCIGDLRSGWNQIPEAWATAERAVIHAYASYL
ncbi:MAG: FAD-dependent oxidoreductase [Thermoplasmata archaeon]|nr:FAD-dependent oxidoreductase [Thermoplasmata archaeon]